MLDFGRSSVLVVDGYKSMVVAVRNVLNQIGCQTVLDASDGSSALQLLRERDGEIDMIISDFRMQPMTGLQLLREVRADRRMRAVPFLMMISAPNVDDIMDAKKSGVSAMVSKPFSAKTLKAHMAAMTAGVGVQRLAS